MDKYEAYVVWHGDRSGEGRFELGSGALTGFFDFSSRAARGLDAAPEELLGAAHAACFTLELVDLLAARDHDIRMIRTRVQVQIGAPERGGSSIESIELHTRGEITGVDLGRFREIAETACDSSRLSRALTGTEIRLEAELMQSGNSSWSG